jgi:hypothetical protein
MSEFEGNLFEGLQALSDSAFPKRCSRCGRQYDSPTDFVRHSRPPRNGSGFKSGYDDDETPLLQLFRNCECGSTLMDFFNDRRDTSERGQKRRQLFGELLEALEQQGLPPEEARPELRKLMNGEHSERLEAMGARISIRSRAQEGDSSA